jgi:hypothetical protein
MIKYLFALIFLFSIADTSKAKKRIMKKRHRIQTQQTLTDASKVIPAPGVVNKTSFDSLKDAKMKLKMKTIASNVVISFISKGEGIDHKGLDAFELFVKKYKPLKNCKIDFSEKSWGREGERDYCITATSESCIDDFLKLADKFLKASDRVNIQKNVVCRD